MFQAFSAAGPAGTLRGTFGPRPDCVAGALNFQSRLGWLYFKRLRSAPQSPAGSWKPVFFFFVHSSCFRSATVPAVPRFPQGIPCTWYTRYSLTQASPVQQQLQLFFTRLLFVTAHGRRLRACVPSYCRILGILNSGTRYQEDLSKFSPGVLVVFARLSAVAAAAVYV